MSQLAQLLRFLDRDDVTEVVLQTDKAPSAKMGDEFRPLSRSTVTSAQIDALVAGSPVAEILPSSDGASPSSRLMLFGKPYTVRAARRAGLVQIRFERAAASVPSMNAVRPSPSPSPASPSPAAAPTPGPAVAKPPPAVSRAVTRLDRASSRDLAGILADARRRGASDVMIVADRPVMVRTVGDLVPEGEPLSVAAVEQMLLPLLSAEQTEALEKRGYTDLGAELPEAGRVRINVSKQRSGLKGSFRLVMDPLPTLETLGLPAELSRVTTYHQGLVVISGPNGQGKTTTLAALVDLINASKAHHILTVEEPVEFLHPRKKALVSQREVGLHTRSFATALKASLREDPDVIVIGELRDRETVEIAITAAETGHLVMATMSTPSAAKTIDRLIDLFPPADQQQVRVTLAGALKFVVAQRLLPNAAGDAFVAAVELLTGIPPLWALIRENKLFQLPNLQQRGRAYGMIRFDDSLAALVREGKITEEVALRYAENKRELVNVLRAGAAPAAAPAAAPVAASGGAPQQKLTDLAARVGKGLFGKKD